MDSKERRKARKKPTAEERRIITEWLQYKLAQVRKAVDHFEAIPKRERTDADARSYATYKSWEQGLRWCFPGGRGAPNG